MDAIIALVPLADIALACPLMMLFMMRGMHGGGGGQRDQSRLRSIDVAVASPPETPHRAA